MSEPLQRTARPVVTESHLAARAEGPIHRWPLWCARWVLLVLTLLTVSCAQIIGAPFDKDFIVAAPAGDGGISAIGPYASCLSRGAECGSFYDEAQAVTFVCGNCAINEQCIDNRCVCETVTCEAQDKECGYTSNGCNLTLDCGSCRDDYSNDPEKAYCDTYGKCGPTPALPTDCEGLRALGRPAECGTVGVAEMTLECGECLGRELCINNLCEGYDPLTCEELTGGGLICGTFPNGAGGEITCGCGVGERCSVGNICCSPRTECQEGACGAMSDGCGGTVECGGCGDGETCLDGVCCGDSVPECPAGVCGAQVLVCGKLLDCDCPGGQCCTGDEDGMGLCRVPQCPTDGSCGDGLEDGCGGTVDGCGCPDGFACNSGKCECVPRTECPTDGTCGSIPDGCGGSLDCYVCPDGRCFEGECCEPTCPSDGSCGLVPDGCGGQVTCECGPGESCKDGLCMTPGCSEDANCGVNVQDGVALSCRGACEDGQECAVGANDIYACGDCSAECPAEGGRCGLVDLGCTFMSCSGSCLLAGDYCVDRASADAVDNFGCCTPVCPATGAVCGDNPDPQCGNHPATCPGACPNGQTCVLSGSRYSCVTKECPENPSCGENQAVPNGSGTLQCWAECGGNDECVWQGDGFICECQANPNPCGNTCGVEANDGCGQVRSCTCPAGAQCRSGQCCTPTPARTVCEAADAQCGKLVESQCQTTVDCGLCNGDQACVDYQCVCDSSKCEANESCDAATKQCKCDSSKCPAGQSCTNAGVCSCDSSKCPMGKECNAQGMCACPQTNQEACGTRRCGTVENECGETVSCGSCNSGRTCSSGQCVCDATAEEACASQNAECGATTNSCGETVSCESLCTTKEQCSGTTCVCKETAAQACQRMGRECGTATNDCGETVTCPNTCETGETCSSNQCVCSDTPTMACARNGVECGETANNCGNTVTCPDTCTEYEECSAMNKCVCSESPAEACDRLNFECGETTNGCGEAITCPACGTYETCSNHECVCTETAAQACARLNLQCGAVTAEDRCGNPVTNCGSCSGAGQTCTNNQCQCNEAACTNKVCGTFASTCTDGGTVNCGACDGTCSPDGTTCTPPPVSDGGGMAQEEQ